MATTWIRPSPVHDQLEALGARWGCIHDGAIALHFGSLEEEVASIGQLALCDFSALPKLGVKGLEAAAWLAGQGIGVPPVVFASGLLPGGGVVVRPGHDEFFLEGGPGDQCLRKLRDDVPSAAGVWLVPRDDATFLLSGAQVHQVMAQCCAVDMTKAAAGRLIMTRVAATSCSVLPVGDDAEHHLRLWVDPSYAVYLWEQLVTIVAQSGGRVVGAACYDRQLSD